MDLLPLLLILLQPLRPSSLNTAAVSPQLNDDNTAAAAALTARHLTLMSFFSGFDPAKMKGWVNMNVEGPLPKKLEAWKHYRIPSLYGKLPSSANCVHGTIFKRGHGACPGWEASLEALATTQILPNLGKDKALRGVFLGDEVCCRSATCWQDGYAPVAAKLRALLGPAAILYTNECGKNWSSIITMVPPDLDLISVDVYSGYTPSTAGIEEVTQAKAVYASIFPKLHSHQQILLVAGIFGCSNTPKFPVTEQEKHIVEKLVGYFEWAKADTRIAGFNPWHFSVSTAKLSQGACDMKLGPGGVVGNSTVLMPSVLAQLIDIGNYITKRKDRDEM